MVGSDDVSGLMGLAVDPNFSDNGYIYTSSTYAYGDRDDHVLGRVVRYTLHGDTLTNRTILLDNIPGGIYSSGSRLEFGPDDNLYITTGIRGNRSAALDPNSLQGKILRIDRNGRIPADNPYSNPVYARGFKNPQGLAWSPETGQLYGSMHGENRYDEINRIRAGGNYGYGVNRCDELSPYATPGRTTFDDNLISPVWCAREWTLAPSGMAFVDDPDSPWYGDLFVASLRGKHLHRFIINAGRVVRNEIFWYNPHMYTETDRYWGRVRDVEYRDGQLWVLMDSGGILTLAPADA